MPDTHLLEQASEILFGRKYFYEEHPSVLADEGFLLTHPEDGRMVSFHGLVRELAEMK
jgi:hypothetical protein